MEMKIRLDHLYAFQKISLKFTALLTNVWVRLAAQFVVQLYVTSAFFFVKNFQDFSFAVSFKRIFGC